MPGKNNDLDGNTMAELAEKARFEGLPFVAHMSLTELIEAIEQQREANALQPDGPRRQDALQPPEPRRPLDDERPTAPS